MHEDGFLNKPQSFFTNITEYIARKTPQGTGDSMGAALAILAVGGGLAASEIILVGLAGYCIGKTIGNVFSHNLRKTVNDTFDDSEKTEKTE